jgi:hypothetical protein
MWTCRRCSAVPWRASKRQVIWDSVEWKRDGGSGSCREGLGAHLLLDEYTDQNANKILLEIARRRNGYECADTRSWDKCQDGEVGKFVLLLKLACISGSWSDL